MDLPKKHVFIHHGPYETCGIVSYQTERLEGMQKLFKSKGHKVDLHEISDRNSVELWVKGELIYKCSIKSLEFGGDGLMDAICAEALLAVEKAF